jgi:dTDP-glucose pyrophosphorylase
MNYLEKIKELSIQLDDTILHALKKMNYTGRKLLLVFKKEKFKGVLSIGDIQRAIIANIPFSKPISLIIRKDFVYAQITDSRSDVLEMMKKDRIECMPVVNQRGDLHTAYLWEDVFPETSPFQGKHLGMPVVIMAGGLGTRLKPLTNIIPKPLIPLGDNTIIEEIFRRFSLYGCDTFYVSVNYKSELIEYYLKEKHLPYDIQFFKEKQPLGTAGSLALLRGRIDKTFFVSNCDILIEQDYAEVLNYHRDNSNEITLVAALKHYPIPYGTVDTGVNGKLFGITEKPELIFKINSGVYILEPSLLDEIPDNRVYDITQLIEKIKYREGRIGVFPVSENSWKDIGGWDLFFKENLIKRY